MMLSLQLKFVTPDVVYNRVTPTINKYFFSSFCVNVILKKKDPDSVLSHFNDIYRYLLVLGVPFEIWGFTKCVWRVS